MTPEQVAHIMALVDRMQNIAVDQAVHCDDEPPEYAEARAAVEAALRDAPQADAGDAAMWRTHVEKLDAVVAYCPTCCQGFTAKKEMTRDEIIFECGKTSGRASKGTPL